MNITMNDANVESIAHLQEFCKSSERVEFQFSNKDEMYQWMGEVLGRHKYFSRATTKKERSIVLTYVAKLTNLSRVQVKKLVRRKKIRGRIERIRGTRHTFPRRYAPADIARLIESDNAHERLSGRATKRILEREYAVYGNDAYDIIRHISVSHVYNLRGTRQYQSHATTVTGTQAVARAIGIRAKPRSDGKPGYIRVDSVHQGDQDKAKGVYHINLVDEVTQWEVTGCVEGISEFFLAPLLEELLALFPFGILGFHSDNGSEYINHTVALLLGKLLVEQTKSRARHCNDNALVESKNGSVIRKHMGYAHIPKRHAALINQFYRDHFIEYLNFHRPCGYATNVVDAKGKVRKKYNVYLTPFEKLKSIPEVERYLKPGTTLAQLEEIAGRMSDNEAGKKMLAAKQKLFENLRQC